MNNRRLILSAFAAAAMAFCASAQSSTEALAKAQSVVENVHQTVAPDARQIIFDIKAYNDNDGNLTVGGKTSETSAREAIVGALNDNGVDFVEKIEVYPADRWAMTRIPVASHRTAGRHSAEMATQSIMGMPLRLLESDGEFWRVQTPDGYIAYVPSSSVVAKTDDEMRQWRNAERFVVTSLYQIRAYNSPEASGPRDVVTDLVNCSIVTVPGGVPSIENGRLHIELPDGRTGWAEAEYFAPIEEWAAQNFNPDTILDTAYSMEGSPYLWGGTSTKTLDCSGLAKVSYLSNGIILMRDASQQAKTGTRIEAKDWKTLRAGDLLFFGNSSTGRVTHVAIYDHDGNYVHSSGRVKRNSVDPESPDYLTTPFLHAVRIAGNEETPGITRARNHPWYF